MSSATLEEIGSLAREAAIQAAWVQWRSVRAGALTPSKQAARSIIDPEALVLVSLAMLDHERRLTDMLAWWARVGTRLLSVQRIKRLVGAYPACVQERLGHFARSAVEAKDARWKRYAGVEPLAARDRQKKETETPNLVPASALMLRLRAGFGVSAKVDVLALLLGMNEREATVQTVAEATNYSTATVWETVRSMALAQFIHATDTRPVGYYVQLQPWSTLLHLGNDIPAWRYWHSMFAFLAHVDAWSRSTESGSEYVLSSQARDLFEVHRGVFVSNRIEVLDAGVHKGAAFLKVFYTAVQAVSVWISKNT